MINNNLIKNFFVTERGVREPGRHAPHSLIFPAMISAVKTFMGLKPILSEIRGHGQTYINDLDYCFQIGISPEGYGLMYGMHEMLKSDLSSKDILYECFLSEGIRYHLIADESIVARDNNLNPDTIESQVLAHLSYDLPVILLTEKHGLKLAIGFTDFGKTLVVHSGRKGVRISQTAEPEDNWLDKIAGVIFIDGLTEPLNRKEVILRALQRAYEMLTETEISSSKYGYGEPMWNKWISNLENDQNYRLKSHVLKFISPEKFDIAERRYFAKSFFEYAETYLGKNSLKDAIYAFGEIHDKMWKIHWMVMHENKGKLLERQTRDDIIIILKECQKLEEQAAMNIENLLIENHKINTDNQIISVTDKNGNKQHSTYLKRAKGLVKKNRACWIDDTTIQLITD